MKGRAGTAIVLLTVLLSIGDRPVRADLNVHFQLTDLGALTGGVSSRAFAINDSGQVVGRYSYYTPQAGIQDQGFLFSNGVVTALNDAAGDRLTMANGIDDAGNIVGVGISQQMPNQALLFSGGAIQNLGTAVGGVVGDAFGINNSGLIVGIAVSGGANTRAFIYDTTNGSITNILPANQSITYPLAINDKGQVVGYTNGFEVTPFLYSQGSVIDLPSFGGVGGSANGINNLGQVVGYSDIASGNGTVPHAFLYANGVMTDIGNVGGPAIRSSWADAINDNGWIVGQSSYYGAFLYANGASYSLHALTLNAQDWSLTEATAINDRGQIVGWGTYKGQERAFLLTPDVMTTSVVPEPSSASTVLAISALVGLAAAVRSRG